MKAMAAYIAIGMVVGGAALSMVKNQVAHGAGWQQRQVHQEVQRQRCLESLDAVDVDRQNADSCTH